MRRALGNPGSHETQRPRHAVSLDDEQVAAAKLEQAEAELDALVRAYDPATADLGVWRKHALEATLALDAAKAELRALTSAIPRTPGGGLRTNR